MLPILPFKTGSYSRFELHYAKTQRRHVLYLYNYAFICGETYKDKNFNLPSDDFILGTATAYGSNETRSINIIVGLKTMKKMKDFKLKGLYYNNVYDYED